MILLETIYRVHDEGMIVEEIDEQEKEDFQAQELPVYQSAIDPIENPLAIH